MHPAVGLPFLVGVAAIILLSGYWFGILARTGALAGRLAQAAVAGLATLLLAACGVNLLLPLSGAGAAVCLLPAAATLAWPAARNRIVADVRSLVAPGPGKLAVGLAAILTAGLLWPLLADWQVLFYDGTTNHDSYISTTAGEFLQSHRYLDAPTASATQPWMNMADDNLGWRPRRAQVGVETLLALCSSLAGTTPLHTILYVAAALLLPWTAAVYLAITTFYRERLSRLALAALMLLQPVFVFFFANSNLPNLLGAVLGAAVVVAVERTLRGGDRRECLAWSVLLAVSCHGLIAAYPEMLPFTLLGCGLLWLRPWLLPSHRADRIRTLAVAAAFLVGAGINPVVTVRAWHGFQHSFATARADVIFANLLEPLNAAEYLPGLATLAVPAALRLGWAGGGLLSLLLLFAAATGWWRARDRWGALCTLAGSAALLAYTLGTGFNYGWQKTVQFGAVFVVALTTAPLIEAMREDWHRPGWRRRLAAASLAGLLGFQVFATVTNLQQIREWSRQKLLSRDWLALRTFAASTLCDRAVLVEAASFRMPFFHSMWAAYFLSPSQSYFARRGGEGGGYLRLGVQDESAVPGGRPEALLVGRRWADGVDFNSPRLLTGREHVLVRAANRVTDLQGFYPVNGIPDHAAARFAIELTPHSPSRLRLTLAPYKPAHWPQATWRLSRRTGAARETLAELAGPPPWQLDVPLLPGTTQTVEGEIVSAVNTSLEWPFAVRQLIIESTP